MKRFYRILLLLSMIGLALLPFILQVVDTWHYTNDDAYITFRYSRNLAEGRGPFFNAGERVEGYTNFLQMLLSAAVIGVFGPAGAPGIVKFTGVLFGISPSFAVNGTSGLETAMFAFWIVLALFLGLHERTGGRWRGSAMAFALALLTRPEGALLFGAYWIACAIIVARDLYFHKREQSGSGLRTMLRSRQVRMLLVDAALVVAVFLAHLAFRYAVYDGELLPNTYFAKQGGFWKGSSWAYVHLGLLVPVFGFAGAAVCITGLWIGRKRIPGDILYVAAIAAAGVLCVLITGIDWMIGQRLAVVYLPVVAVLAVSGWILLLSSFRRSGPVLAVLALAAVLPGAWLLQSAERTSIHDRTLIRSQGYGTGHAALADWISDRAAPGDSIALMDIGIVVYECIDQRILDVTGLTDRFIAKSPGGFLRKKYDPAYILDRRPQFIVITLRGAGESYSVPAKGTVFKCWTQLESDLVQHPRFRRWHTGEAAPRTPGQAGWLDVLAANIGADKVFEHGYPGMHYLLAVYCRNTEPAVH